MSLLVAVKLAALVVGTLVLLYLYLKWLWKFFLLLFLGKKWLEYRLGWYDYQVFITGLLPMAALHTFVVLTLILYRVYN